MKMDYRFRRGVLSWPLPHGLCPLLAGHRPLPPAGGRGANVCRPAPTDPGWRGRERARPRRRGVPVSANKIGDRHRPHPRGLRFAFATSFRARNASTGSRPIPAHRTASAA